MWSYFRITDLFKNLAKTWLILATNNRLQLLPKMKNESLKMWQVHGGPDDLSNIVLFKNYQISLKGFHNFHRKKGRNILTGFHYFVKLNHPPISNAFNIFRVDSPDG